MRNSEAIGGVQKEELPKSHILFSLFCKPFMQTPESWEPWDNIYHY
jgi:hypothetical protein